MYVIRIFNETIGAGSVNEEDFLSIKFICIGSTDITQTNFNPYYYLLAHKSNAT
jgi:hypothetical protein